MDTFGPVGTGDRNSGVHVRFGRRISGGPRFALSGEESAYGGRDFVSGGSPDRRVLGSGSLPVGEHRSQDRSDDRRWRDCGSPGGSDDLQSMSEQNFKRFFAGILVLLAIWLVFNSRLSPVLWTRERHIPYLERSASQVCLAGV